ncbi:MAG: hypothetical protein ACFFDP_03030, partial [Promethearchaeota archaeon]
MKTKHFGLMSGIVILLLIGSILPTAAQSTEPYSVSVTPTPFLTPRPQWTVVNVTTEAVEWGWGSGDYWETKAGEQVIFEIQDIRDGELHGLFTIGNLSLMTNDSRIAAELTFSIWPWFPGLVSHLDWSTVDQNATDSATGWMEGDLEIRTTASTKTYIYHQGLYGNQNTTLVYDLSTGILQEGYTEFFFLNDYHLGLKLVQSSRFPTSFTVMICGIAA